MIVFNVKKTAAGIGKILDDQSTTNTTLVISLRDKCKRDSPFQVSVLSSL